jgi:FkbM family methyltransferase
MGFAKTFLKAKLHPLVWDRLGQAKQEFWYTRRSFHCEDELLPIFNSYLNFENGFYVDIGANDGRSSSNTYHLEKLQGWSGVLIEPIMHVHFRSREIRDLDRNQFFCCALVDKHYEGESVELIYSGLMSIASGNVSDFNSTMWSEMGGEFLARGEQVQKTWSEARTLISVLQESKAPKVIDFLSIDTEGSEFSILKNFDFENWEFRFVLIEAALNSAVHVLLIDQGYRLISQKRQNLFFINEKHDFQTH